MNSSNKKMLARKIFLPLISITFLFLGIWLVGIEDILVEFSQFPLWSVLAVLAVFLLNLAVVSFRLKKLLKYFNFELPYSVAAKASVQGHFAALFFISLFGQVVGRQLVLKQFGTPSVLVAMLTAMEKAVLLVVGGVVGFLGAAWLIDSTDISDFFGKTSFIQLALAILLSTIASVVVGSSKFEAKLISKTFSRSSIGRFLRLVGITALAQGTVLSSFVIAGHALAPEVAFIDLLAAAALTSFAASLPISVNGWGIREITAVFAFGAVGVPDSVALATSVLVGLASTAVVLIAYPFSLIKTKSVDSSSSILRVESMVLESSESTLSAEKIGAWTMAIGLSVLVFFQVHVPLAGGVINLNLADAFALISLAAIIAYAVEKRSLPSWAIERFNVSLSIITLVLVLGFLNGVLAIGVTQWALVGRVIGWAVLLGYLSIGLMAVTFLGQYGLRRLAETLIVTAVVVICFQIVVRTLSMYGIVDPALIPANFEGYSGNRNAFVFQVICCIVLILAYSERYARVSTLLNESKSYFVRARYKIFQFFLGILLCGVVLTGSRAGILTVAILLTFVWFSHWVSRKMLITSLLVAACAWVVSAYIVPVALPWITSNALLALVKLLKFIDVPSECYGTLSNVAELTQTPVLLQSSLSNEASNHERWATLYHGFELWKDSPWFGTGLGVFIEKSPQWFGHDIVIHSTPVWILTEFGLVGLLAFIVAFGLVVYSIWAEGLRAAKNRGVLLLFGVFLTFSLVHEMFAQRIFWLTLGILIALPIPSLKKKVDENNE
ncbi:lysylphosphatidylglycerol synthase domain-containing protein [Vibrio europaeus]|uniref:O-antigen ligase family protein n=1 Tax=Vibrio europaeus TaxID=300876 RepID=UPI00233FC43A|nr:O-antigen ligase family protein [Vibrio europaeus]MDC5850446.1 lysylphosphatidylglycerol synthase domain-containing protein [Vibrio europaeus]